MPLGPEEHNPKSLFDGGILSRDGKTVAPKRELGEIVFKHTIGIGMPDGDGLIRASGTLINVGGHLRIATARHVAEAMYLDPDGQIAVSGYRLFEPYQISISHVVSGDARYLKVQQIQYPKECDRSFKGVLCPFPDVALIELSHTFEIARYAPCWGGVFTSPINDVLVAVGYPAEYQNQCLCVVGDDPEIFVDRGINIYRMGGLAGGHLVRAIGVSKAYHESFGGMSGGGLWAYINIIGWSYIGVVFFETHLERADTIYSIASSELIRLF